MLKNFKRVLLASGAAGAALTIGMSSAYAATWTVSAGSLTSGTTTYTAATPTGTSSAPAIKFVDTTDGVTLQCLKATANGSAALGSGLSGTPLATIAGSTFTTCTGPLGISLTVTQSGTWNLNGSSYSGGVTQGYVSNVTANISGTCSFSVTGAADGTYTNSNGTLDMSPVSGSGHTLKISTPTGGKVCFNLISNGATATFSTTAGDGYKVTTPTGNLVVTSP
ncbi:MAG TPA: hypothetical protein VMB79_10385 [Jatrophihabitans sp.]|nr:hypothetical protein [Jatrophihabitans sp.]